MTEDFNAGRLYLDAYVDTKGVTKGLQARLNAETARIRAKIKAEVNAKGAAVGLQPRVNAEVARIKAKIKAEIDVSQITRGLQSRLNAATRDVKAKIHAEVDEASIAKVKRQISSAASDANAEIDVDADTAGAEAQIDTAARDRTVNMDIKLGGLSQVGSAISQLSMFPAMVGGFYTLGTAIVQVGGGLLSMASSASVAAGALAAIPNLAGVALQGLGALMAGFSGIGAAVKAMTQQQAQAGQFADKQAKARKKDAQQARDDARQQAEAAHNRLVQIRSARDAVVNAEASAASAHRNVREAQQDLTRARQEARLEIIKMRRELENSINSEQDAMDKLATAREDLQDVNWDAAASPQERREAERAVREAQNNLENASNDRKDAAADVKKANKEGIAGDEQVIAAQRRVTDAKASAANADRQVAAARRALAEAQRPLAKSSRDSAAAADLQNTALQGVATAMDNLSPAGQRFARFLQNTLMPRFKQMKFAIQEALLPPLQRGITAAMPMLDTLEKGLVGTAGVIGQVGEKLGNMLGKKAFNNDVEKIMGSNNRAMLDFGKAGLNVIRMLRDLAVVAGPVLLEPFAKWLRILTRSGATMVRTGRESGALEKWLKRAGNRAAQLGDIFWNLISALYGVGKAANKGAGDDLLNSFEKTTKAWSKFANSDAGQEKMRKFFEATKPTTKAVGRLIASLTEFFAKASGENTGPLVTFFDTLTWVIDRLNAAMSVPGVGKFVGWMMALAGVAGGLGLVAGMILRIGGSITKIAKVTGISKLVKSLRGVDGEAGPAKKALQRVGTAAKNAGKAALDGGKKFGKMAWGGITKGAKAAGGWLSRTSRAMLDIGKRGAVAAGRGLAAAARGFTGLARAAGAATWAMLKFVGAQVRAAAAAALNTAKMIAQRIVTAAISAATKTWAAVQWLLNAAMSANPIGIIIIALIALGAALVLLWKKSDTFRRIVKRAWAGIQQGAKVMWKWLKPIFRLMTAQFRLAGAIAKWLWRHAIKPAWDNISRGAKIMWNRWLKPAFDNIRRGARILGDKIAELWKKHVKPVWDNIARGAKWVWNKGIKPAFTNIREGLRTLRTAFNNAKDAIGRAWDKIREKVKKPIHGVISLINSHIIKPFNTVSGKLGGPKIGYIDNTFSRGGKVGGHSPTTTADNIPALLTAEEQVIRVKAARRMRRENPGVMEFINKHGTLPAAFSAGGRVIANGAQKLVDGVVRLARGGVVWPTVGRRTGTYAGHDGVDINQPPGPDFGAPIYAYRSGRITYVGSGRGYGAPAIFEKGDVGPEVVYGHASRARVHAGQRVAAGQIIGNVGSTGNSTGPHLHFGVPGGTTAGALALLRGATHVAGGKSGGGFSVPSFLSTLGSKIAGAVKGGASWFMDKAKGAISGLRTKYGDTALVKMLQGMPKKLISSAGAKIKSLFGGAKKKYDSSHKNAGPATEDYSGRGGRLSPAQARAAGHQMMPKGWSWAALNNLWNRESGWRWNADNPTSSAYGIPQSLPGSKMASAGRDWLTNAITQIRWGLGYIRGRYGSSGAAWAHSQATGWYDRGGALYPGSTYAYNGTGKIETVFTNENIVAMTQNLERVARTMLSTITEGDDGRMAALVENLNLYAQPNDMPQVLGDAEHELRKIRIGGPHAAKRP